MAVQPDFNSDVMDGAMVSSPHSSPLAHHRGPYWSLLLCTDCTSLHCKANVELKASLACCLTASLPLLALKVNQLFSPINCKVVYTSHTIISQNRNVFRLISLLPGSHWSPFISQLYENVLAEIFWDRYPLYLSPVWQCLLLRHFGNSLSWSIQGCLDTSDLRVGWHCT